MVHLRRLPRLRQCVGLIDQQDHRAARPARCAFELLGLATV